MAIRTPFKPNQMLQTPLQNAGMSVLGAVQVANGVPVVDPRDRQTLSILLSQLLVEKLGPAGNRHIRHIT